MPFTDLKGAARLVERIDEILALVRAWKPSNGHPEVVEVPEDQSLGAEKFFELDARIHGLVIAIGFPAPSPQRHDGAPLSGFTRLGFSANWRGAYGVVRWAQGLIALKHAAQEILDVAKSNEPDRRTPDTPAVRELCDLLSKKAGSGRPFIQVARDYTGEKPGKDRRAKMLLRQAQRFPHLWKRDDE
jgi:hypothetical protein